MLAAGRRRWLEPRGHSLILTSGFEMGMVSYYDRYYCRMFYIIPNYCVCRLLFNRWDMAGKRRGKGQMDGWRGAAGRRKVSTEITGTTLVN